MQIHLASLLAAVLLLFAVAAGGYNVYNYYEYVPPLLIALSVVAAATIFTLSNQINWWWFERHPPRLDALGASILKANLPYFAQLSIDERKRFGSRVYMFLMDKDFVSAGTPDDEVPEEFKVMIAACCIQFTFGMQEYWFPDLEKIIVYPRLFPTRERPAFHAGEAHDDNCMLLSGMMTREGMSNSAAYYHIGLHVAAEYWAMRKPVSNAELHIENEAVFLEKIEKIRCFKPDFWRELTGIHTKNTNFGMTTRISEMAEETLPIVELPEIDTPYFPLAVECFFTKPDEMAALLPDVFDALQRIIKQDPRRDTYPVLKISMK